MFSSQIVKPTHCAVLKIVILGLCIINYKIDAHILVYTKSTNKLIDDFNDMPAAFGPSLPPNGLKFYPHETNPRNGCNKIEPINRSRYGGGVRIVAIIERGGENCTFELKVRNAQQAHFDAVIVYNNKSDDLEQMRAENSTGINIPSVFVAHTTGLNLLYKKDDITVVINDEPPFNINTQLILPFSILIGLCFLVMVFYMIYKCIREERRLRRYRLPKRLLKKLPILKYTKNSDISYDTCVICLDEFIEGDKLRVLPCKHPYHSHCIDPWLTQNRRVCPICKRKVFTKGTVRLNRYRQSSLDSVTDTDDDTTPLLQPASNATATRTPGTDVVPTATAATTHHGTFRREGSNSTGNTGTADLTSDEENILLAHQSPTHGSRRINPFNRINNETVQQTAQPAEQLNETPSLFENIFNRLFRRVQSVSVAAPPYLEEIVSNNPSTNTSTIVAPATSLPCNVSASTHSSNNILNPNLSGSFKDESESPHQSIYEPIAVVTPTNVNNESENGIIQSEADLIFVQTPSQGGIGVVALPNTSQPVRGPTNRDGQFFI